MSTKEYWSTRESAMVGKDEENQENQSLNDIRMLANHCG